MNNTKGSRRTHQKVWRDSLTAGAYESEVYRPYSRDEMAVCLEAAERYDRAHKLKGQRNGPIGHVGLEVYRALWRRVNFGTGRLDPSIEGIMKATGRSRGAVVEALKRLWDVGLVRWIRRLAPTGQWGVVGPQVQQCTNAYELRTLGERFLSLLSPGKRSRYRPRMRPAPAPRERGKQSPMLRVGAAWGRMSEAIRDHLAAKWAKNKTLMASYVVEVVGFADDLRESTMPDQTLPDGSILTS